jgi:uncharacterized protein
MMTEEELALRTLRRERVARVKRLLRWLPRRATMHRYPILKWFAASARKRAYLWSFRTEAAVPAIYAGCILAFAPLYGVQIPLAVAFAFLLRANLPILVGIQIITNPVTVVPLYFAAFAIGRHFLQVFGVECPHLSVGEFKLLFHQLTHLDLHHSLAYVSKVFGVTVLGSTMMGLFTAFFSSLLYRFGAHEVTRTYHRLHELQLKREEAQRAAEAKQSRPKNRFPKGRRWQTP